MPSREAKQRERQALLFAALGDETRLALVVRLGRDTSDGVSIQSLTEDTALTRQAVTKHLRVLEHVGLVRCHREGRESRFTLIPQPLDRARQYLEEVSRQWDDALLRLKAFAERDANK